MTAYHATHPSPYDDACPDCAGYDEPTATDRSWSGLVMALAFLGLAVIVLLARILR